jgi:RNA polymerase sigma-70 factor (ECF subfamily)
VVQTTLIKALPVLKGAEKHPNVSALLRRIAKNTWLDHVRKQRKFRPYNPMELSAVCGSMPPEERLEVEAAFQVLIQQLTAQQRAVFLLCEVFEYTDREAGELLGISRGAVKATLRRAKVRLTSMKKIPSERDDGVQKEVLQAYVAAFHAADISTLMHLCLGGALDPVHATSKVLTFARRQTNARRTNGGTQMSILAAA